jgi:hypothetical protein
VPGEIVLLALIPISWSVSCIIFHPGCAEVCTLGTSSVAFKLNIILFVWLVGFVEAKKFNHLPYRMDIPQSGVQIRVPATANLMIDSVDRTSGNTSDFLIQKNQAILNGFFNRIGTTEVVLEWALPNISAANGAVNPLGNNTLEVIVTGAPANPYTITLPTSNYTIAEALDEIAVQLNALALGSVFVVAGTPLGATITSNAATWSINPGNLQNQLGLSSGVVGLAQTAFVRQADLRNIRYLDFVSDTLTYNQELKDDSTNAATRSVLCRWYFAYDQPPTLDAYGFPVLMGYQPFYLRRIFNPPKQIKWDHRQPIGQLTFQVYTDQGVLVASVWNAANTNSYFNWLMTLQASEN